MKDIKLIMENWRSFLTEEKVSHSIPRVEILSALADDVSNYGEHDAALNEESLEEEKMSGKKIAEAIIAKSNGLYLYLNAFTEYPSDLGYIPLKNFLHFFSPSIPIFKSMRFKSYLIPVIVI
jgi:hypothetical protein